MKWYEYTGTLRILKTLLENDGKFDSKFKLRKSINIDPDTFERAYEILINKELIMEDPNIGPKKRTVVELTRKGKEFAEKFKEALDTLE